MFIQSVSKKRAVSKESNVYVHSSTYDHRTMEANFTVWPVICCGTVSRRLSYLFLYTPFSSSHEYYEWRQESAPGVSQELGARISRAGEKLVDAHRLSAFWMPYATDLSSIFSRQPFCLRARSTMYLIFIWLFLCPLVGEILRPKECLGQPWPMIRRVSGRVTRT
jgi:hypothetical protein